MVRQQLNSAVRHFQQLTVDKDSPFGNLDSDLSESDMNLLRIGAWMHDIGKASATTITKGKIQAIGHENPEHFEPMMQRLGQPWKRMYDQASGEDKQDLWFMIQHHMNLTNSGFSKKLLMQLLDKTGKFINDRKIKLLLILIMMDQSGRLSLNDLNGDAALPGISNNMRNSAVSARFLKASAPATDDPIAFVNQMRTRGLIGQQIRAAFQGKFGRPPSPDEFQESFRMWIGEYEEHGYNFYKTILLGKMNLDQVHGLSQGLDTWEPDQLISILNSLGEFKELPDKTQEAVFAQIRSRLGTLGDLIRIMSSTARI